MCLMLERPWRQDQYERVLLNLYVKPDRPVVSYLTPLTGYDSSGACLEPKLCLCSRLHPRFTRICSRVVLQTVLPWAGPAQRHLASLLALHQQHTSDIALSPRRA